MRGALHLLCSLLLLPYFFLAAWFLILGDAIGSGSLISFFGTLLAHAAWLLPWGFLGFASGFVVLVLLGLIERLRWLGGLCLFAIAAVCLAVIGMTAVPASVGEVLFLLPCAAIAACGAWLAMAEAGASRRASQRAL